MRMSGIMLGGLLGAAATLYLSRKRPGAMAWASSAMSDIASKSVTKVMNGGWKKEAAAALAPKHSEDTAAKSAAAWEQINAIVESDPSVKREVNKIKAESSSHSHH
ncbi:hypothetical protein D3P08_08430 [Paenibacillus nanensis]|uniref:YtxH domain-containing protein n=1 Tax=Paenibacillus nanensis TaxID=393251 RepID=A0A3A1UY58_9BACL|nr:hypothetical protein [Paenibacillus nanensis]RIX53458.1 hypothetical protein D3P08_08430 [Paenibacillus nanensis]